LYRQLQRRLIEHLRDFLRRKYRVELQNVDLLNIVVEQPPKPEMGEYALPLCFELAKRLRKAPRKIAEEIVAELAPPKGFARFEVAGAGYINARIERAPAARSRRTKVSPRMALRRCPICAALLGLIEVCSTRILPGCCPRIFFANFSTSAPPTIWRAAGARSIRELM